MSQSVEHRVIQIIAKSKQISPDSISLDQSIEDICQDSLDIVSLLFDLEDAFDLDIPDDAKTSKTVRDIVREIEQHMRVKEATKIAVE